MSYSGASETIQHEQTVDLIQVGDGKRNDQENSKVLSETDLQGLPKSFQFKKESFPAVFHNRGSKQAKPKLLRRIKWA